MRNCATYVVLSALSLFPLYFAAIPPLVDYPNHLARMWILLHAADIPSLAANYVVHWQWVPNLAMDLVVPALAQAMPLELAGRVFIGLTMLSLAAGTAAVHRALYGKVGVWPACSFLFVFNAALSWGFLNFLFGLGAALLAFAGWIATERWDWRLRIAVFAAVSVVLFFLHLFTFCTYGLLIASFEAGEFWSTRREWTARSVAIKLAAFLQFVPAIILYGCLRSEPWVSPIRPIPPMNRCSF